MARLQTWQGEEGDSTAQLVVRHVDTELDRLRRIVWTVFGLILTVLTGLTGAGWGTYNAIEARNDKAAETIAALEARVETSEEWRQREEADTRKALGALTEAVGDLAKEVAALKGAVKGRSRGR